MTKSKQNWTTSKISWSEFKDAKKIGSTITVASGGLTTLGCMTPGAQGYTQGTRILISDQAEAGVMTHEMGHIMQNHNIMDVDNKVQILFEQKEKEGNFATEYSSKNKNEYFAEGLKLYSNEEGQKSLKEKDLRLYELLQDLEKQGKLKDLNGTLQNIEKITQYKDPDKFKENFPQANEYINKVKEQVNENTKKEASAMLETYDKVKLTEDLKEKDPKLYDYLKGTLDEKGKLTKEDIEKDLKTGKSIYEDPESREELKKNNPALYEYLKGLDENKHFEE